MDGGLEPRVTRRGVLMSCLGAGLGALAGGCAARRPGDRSDVLWTDQPPSWPRPGETRRPTGPVAGESRVIPRREWTSASPRLALANPMRSVTRITVHHDAMISTGIRSRADAASRLEAIRRAHVGRDWADIGYHFVIDPLGNVWEGRPIALQGAHVKDHNEGNLGVMVMGNFDAQAPSPMALEALERFLVERMRVHRVSARAVHTHRELGPTQCPGTSLQAQMVRLRGPGGALRLA
jgi:hypothetical protein